MNKSKLKNKVMAIDNFKINKNINEDIQYFQDKILVSYSIPKDIMSEKSDIQNKVFANCDIIKTLMNMQPMKSKGIITYKKEK